MNLAKKLVASPSWRWMPGMLATHHRTSDIRVVTCDGDSADPHIAITEDDWPVPVSVDEYGITGDSPDGDVSSYPFLPDLEDPATLGCVLALVRAHLDAPRARVEVRADMRARVVSPIGSEFILDYTGWVVGGEAAALVEALTQAKRGDR